MSLHNSLRVLDVVLLLVVCKEANQLSHGNKFAMGFMLSRLSGRDVAEVVAYRDFLPLALAFLITLQFLGSISFQSIRVLP